MATRKLPLLLLSLSLLAVTATARPCKTLFFFTSTSYYPIPTTHPSNPNPNPRSLTFFFTTARVGSYGEGSRFGFKKPSMFLGRNAIFFEEEDRVVDQEEEVLNRPVEFYSSVTSSIRDRTKDIMQVMGAMLFGAGCGALTAATMYMIWSLCWPTSFDFEDVVNDDEDVDDDDASPKKMGYVVLPATKVVADDDLKKPVKEVV